MLLVTIGVDIWGARMPSSVVPSWRLIDYVGVVTRFVLSTILETNVPDMRWCRHGDVGKLSVHSSSGRDFERVRSTALSCPFVNSSASCWSSCSSARGTL